MVIYFLAPIEVRAWVGNHIPPFHVDMITNPCLHPDAGGLCNDVYSVIQYEINDFARTPRGAKMHMSA